ncbi:hypothetical protein BJX70DRAFT_361553 [Aspergillus crustosus]
MSSSGYYEPGDDHDLTDTPSIIPRVTRGSRAKALKDLRSSLPEDCVDSYTKLLQQTYNGEHDPTESKLSTTQDGIVIWTPQEKTTFFKFLDMKGQNGIQEIAAAIKTKSELEVQEYIRLLQKGVRRQQFEEHPRTVVFSDIPAASEIREQCCETLDEYAELLRLEEQRAEDKAGKESHGDLWIIDQEIAEQLEDSVIKSYAHNDTLNTSQELTVHLNIQSKIQDEHPGSRIDIQAAATLFKTTKWILLSERFFMNFGGHRLEDNWANIAFKGETPSITADVYHNFYEIALTVTRRLVHATHLFASSRVRRNQKPSRRSAKVVKSSDVRRAARTLNMKTDASDFWLGLARRCNLDVEDRRHKKSWDPIPLDHDEVEMLLSQRKLPEEPYERRSPSPRARSRSSSITSNLSETEYFTGSEDEYAEALDQQHSLAEERLCWSTLGQSPPAHLTQASIVQSPTKPKSKRKTMEELVDWRDRTIQRNEWEEHGHETENIETFFKAQRKKRRLTAAFRPLSDNPRRSKSNHSAAEDQDTTPEPEYQNIGLANLECEYHTEESDPEFRPDFPTRVPMSSMTRTSARTRTPVSYAPPQFLDLDMEMDIDNESNDQKDVFNAEDEEPYDENNETEDADEKIVETSSESDDNLPEPQERIIPASSDEDESEDEDEDDELYPRHRLSTPISISHLQEN